MAIKPIDTSLSAEARRLQRPLEQSNTGGQIPAENIDGDGLAKKKAPSKLSGAANGSLDRELREAPEIARRLFRREAQAATAKPKSGQTSWLGNLTNRFGRSQLDESLSQLSKAKTTARPQLTDAKISEGAAATAAMLQAGRLVGDVRQILAASAQPKSLEAISDVANFQRGPQLSYYASSLGAQYQQLYLAKETNRTILRVGQILEQKLEAIKLNTSASEIRKRSIADILREKIVTNAAGKVAEYANTKVAEIVLPFVKRKAVDPLVAKTTDWFKSASPSAVKARQAAAAAMAAKDRVGAALERARTGGAPAGADAGMSPQAIERQIRQVEKRAAILRADLRTAEGSARATLIEQADRLNVELNNLTARLAATPNGSRALQRIERAKTELSRITTMAMQEGRKRAAGAGRRATRGATPGAKADLSPTAVAAAAVSMVNRARGAAEDSVDADSLDFQDAKDTLLGSGRASVERAGAAVKERLISLSDRSKNAPYSKTTLAGQKLKRLRSASTVQARRSVNRFNTEDAKERVAAASGRTRLGAAEAAAIAEQKIRTLRETVADGSQIANERIAAAADSAQNWGATKADEAASSARSFSDSVKDRYRTLRSDIRTRADGFRGPTPGGMGPIKPQRQEETTLFGSSGPSDPMLDEVRTFHQDFLSYSDRSASSTERIIEALENMALGGGEGGGGGGSPGKQAWWKRGLGDLAKGALRGTGRGILGGARLYGRGLRGALGIGAKTLGVLNPLKRVATEPFVDVYRKGEVRLGNPLVTAKRLRAGMVFASGEPVGDVADITQPVLDPATKEVVISQDDVTHGLVDANGTPLTKRGATTSAMGRLLNFAAGTVGTAGRLGAHLFSTKNPLWGLYGKMFGMLGGIAGGFGKMLGGALSGSGGLMKGLGSLVGKAAGPLFKAYGDLLGLGVDAAKMSLRGAGKLIGRMFGFGDNGKGGMASRKDLEQVVGDRLDDIYKLLLDWSHGKVGGGGVKGDADGDGDRDGSYKDYLQRMEDRKKKNAEATEGVGPAAAGGKRGMMAKLLGAAGALFGAGKAVAGSPDKKDDKEDEGGSGGMIETAAATAAGLIMPKWLKKGGGLIKRTAGRIFGSGAAKAATAVGGTAAAAVGSAAAGAAAKTATKVAASSGAKIVAKSASRALLKKIPLLGLGAGALFAMDRLRDGDILGATMELGSGIVSLVPIFGTAASIAIDGLLLGRDLSKDTPASQIAKARFEAYGVPSPSGDQIKAFLKLEDLLYEVLRGGSSTRHAFSRKAIKSILPAFGFEDTALNYDYMASWIRWRMQKVYAAYLVGLDSVGVEPSDAADMTKEQAAKALAVFNRQIGRTISAKTRLLAPNPAALKRIVVDKSGNITESESKLDDSDEKSDDKDKDKAKDAANDNKEKPAVIDPRRRKGSLRAAPLPGSEVRPPSDPQKDAGLGPEPNQRSAAAAAKVLAFTPTDTSLGGLSAHYESGKRGSEAVGYDTTGGTSYGKYQISSRRGTFSEFVLWLKRKGGDAAVLGAELRNAGRPNTRSTAGGVPDAWRKAAAEGRLKDYEHLFIKESHYDEALRRLPEELRTRIEKSDALKNVLWSTAVQHGPGGAASLFRASSEGAGAESDEAFIRNLYKDRATKFSSSTANVKLSVRNRMVAESQMALAAYAKEKQATPKDGGAETGGPQMLADASSAMPKDALAEGPAKDSPMADSSSTPPAQKRPSAEPRVSPLPASTSSAQRLAAIDPAEGGTVGGSSAKAMEDAVEARQAAKQTESAASETKVAVSVDTAETTAELRQVNQNLTALLTVMSAGMGDPSNIERMSKAVEAISKQPPTVVVAAPTVNTAAAGGDDTRKRAHAGIDMRTSNG